jgi:hypothetical protein
MLKKSFQKQLLENVYEDAEVSLFDFVAAYQPIEAEPLKMCREWTQPRVKDKLLGYVGEKKTMVTITNSGKYWMLTSGYLTYLRDEHDVKKRKNLEKELHEEQLLEARLKLTHYRLFGFWITLIVSALGFILSLINLYLYLSAK